MFRIHPRTLLKAALLPTALLLAAGGSQAAFAGPSSALGRCVGTVAASPNPGAILQAVKPNASCTTSSASSPPQHERGPMRAQRVPGDQHGIRVKVAAAGPGYRLGVVDGSAHSTGHTDLNTPPAAPEF